MKKTPTLSEYLVGLLLARLLILFLVLFGFIITQAIYGEYHYLDEIKNTDKISLLNYRELPKLVDSWSGAEKLITGNRSREYISGNSSVRGFQFLNKRLRANLYFSKPDTEDRSYSKLIESNYQARPDIEDNDGKKTATITYEPFGDSPMGPPLGSRYINLSDTALFSAVRFRGNALGKGYQRSRIQLELVDNKGKIMRGPKVHLAFDGQPTYLILRPTMEGPIPTGSAMGEFDPSQVTKINIRFTLGRYPDGVSHFPASGELEVENIYLIKNLVPVVNFFGQPNQERVTRDNINLAYKWRKSRWENEEQEFFVGINYPWHNYGWDIGRNPYGEPANSGWSAYESKLREDLLYLKNAGIEPVRIYIFFDLRTGLKYQDGKLIGFDEFVKKDIETIIRIAGEAKIKIMPVLFDFGIADGNGNGVGEHPELIFSSDKSNFLINLIRPLLQDMEKWNDKYGHPIFALEMMNEPENMAALIIPGYFESLKNWFKDLANIIHNETSFKITLGSHSIVDMQRWWDDVDIDIRQFHFYKYMFSEHEKWPHNVKRDEVAGPGMVFCGEMQPFDLVRNIEAVKSGGYAGLFLWSFRNNDGFGMADTKEMDEVISWISKNKIKKP